MLTVFASTGQRHIEWTEPPPIAGAPDGEQRVRLVAADRFGLFSLLNGGNWKSEQELPPPTTEFAVFSPDGQAFARWPAGENGLGIEVWQWSAHEPRLTLFPASSQGRLGKGSFALTERTAVWCAGGNLIAWDLQAPDQPHALPLGGLRPYEVRAALTGEVWVNTTAGSLIVLAPAR